MVTLASNIASQAQTEYRMMLESALNAGITPIEIKEILYQAVAYAGMAKVMDFVGITNEALLAHGVRLPLEGQAVVLLKTVSTKDWRCRNPFSANGSTKCIKMLPKTKSISSVISPPTASETTRHAVDWT